MKYFLLLFIAGMLSNFNLSAQTEILIWHSIKSEGSSNKFKPMIKGGVVFEVEVKFADVRIEKNGSVLSFKNSDGILIMNRLSGKSQFKNTSGFLEFRDGKKTYYFKKSRGNIKLPLWPSGKAAIIINKGEQVYAQDRLGG